MDLRLIQRGTPLPADADVILLPGSKSTIADLACLRAEGWEIDIAAHVRRGGHVMGLCGGYQMLGQTIADPAGVEGPSATVAGLGLLDVHTTLAPLKTLALRHGTDTASGTALTGYEIHMGETTGADTARAWLQVDGSPAGAASANGRVKGCYLHGIFGSDAYRAAFLAQLGQPSDLSYDKMVDDTLDALAQHLETHMDIDLLLRLAAEV